MKKQRVECALCHATFYKRLSKCPNCGKVQVKDGPVDFTRTRKMLAWYDKQEARRSKLLDDVIDNKDSTDEEALKAVNLWKVHADVVRKAFHLDTADRNSLDHCMLVDISWLREISDPKRKFVQRRPPK